MKVLFASSECAPFFKTGGLGDVAQALPKEMKKQGTEIRVVLPFYSSMLKHYKDQCEDVIQFYVKLSWRNQYCGIKKLILNNVIYYFIDNQYYFDREQLYGYDDDFERFAFFSQGVIEMMERMDYIPDILHVNDWHTSIIPVLLKEKYFWFSQYSRIKTVLTIHNLEFQGIAHKDVLSDLYGIGVNSFHEHGLEYYGRVNVLKGGIFYSDLVTTVSYTYAKEIQTPEFGKGLEGVLSYNNHKLVGIVNGIDYELFNPETDQKIVQNYSTNCLEGKKINKLALQEQVGLPVNEKVPLISMVSRLTVQKGLHLIEEIMPKLMLRDVQILILGTGDKTLEKNLSYYNEKYPHKFKAIIGFDVELAQQIYAGSDLFIMPSAFEPCGLSQLNSMRYGTLPIVHETGGLKDTVEPYNLFTSEGTGFSFYDYNAETLLNTIDLSLNVYYENPKHYEVLVKRAMGVNSSWEQSTKTYIEQYKKLI